MISGEGGEIVEVSLRDGIQSISRTVPTKEKIAIVDACLAAGIERIEIGSIVSQRALPQMRDIFDVWSDVRHLPGLQASVLVPNVKGAELAAAAGIVNLVYVLSVSEAHNRSNLNRSVERSLADLQAILRICDFGRTRLDLATAFHCPFEGRIDPARVISILDQVAAWPTPKIEIALCDTTGRATPRDISFLFSTVAARYPDRFCWAYHPHNTYGLGIAGVFAAYNAGVRVFDASLAGIGGCPFAPGATGNAATEDVVFSLEESGVRTGVDLWAIASAAEVVASLDGAQAAGSIRDLIRRGTLRPNCSGATADPVSPLNR